jgi:hypothetical protein
MKGLLLLFSDISAIAAEYLPIINESLPSFFRPK